jgi:hypothetical protein
MRRRTSARARCAHGEGLCHQTAESRWPNIVFSIGGENLDMRNPRRFVFDGRDHYLMIIRDNLDRPRGP